MEQSNSIPVPPEQVVAQMITMSQDDLIRIVHDAERAVITELREEDKAAEAFAQHWDKIMILVGITLMIIFAMFDRFDPWGVITGSASMLGTVVRSLPFINPRN